MAVQAAAMARPTIAPLSSISTATVVGSTPLRTPGRGGGGGPACEEVWVACGDKGASVLHRTAN
eukprot:359963-Chlamydomonas_euryale.AAC.1